MKKIDPDFRRYLEILAAMIILASLAMALGYAGPPSDMGTESYLNFIERMAK